MRLWASVLFLGVILVGFLSATQFKIHLDEKDLEGFIQFKIDDWVAEDYADREPLNVAIEDDPPTMFAASLNVSLIGKSMWTYNNTKVYAFQGLRYAERSGKENRFKPPMELQPPYFDKIDNGTVLVNHLPPKCAQHGLFTPNIPAGLEDCLYLSVYTRNLPDSETGDFDELLPVMIFFHGGAFIWGDSSLYLPTRLLDHPVLLVVPHYRLGSFGFFSTMDANAPGNIGLYDQRMSMVWVQTHIASFGGDPDRVTIFGQSAGSASVNYHLLTELSKGLFHQVIGESGSAIEHWSLDVDPLDSAQAIANFLGCDCGTDINLIYEFMMNVDAGELAVGINELSKQDRQNGMMGFRGAAPIIQNADLDLSQYDTRPMVTKQPEQYFIDGDFNKDVSLMIGANKQEGSFIFAIMIVSYALVNNLTENEAYIHEQMIPDLLNSFGIEDKTHSLAESLAVSYLKQADRTDLDSCTPGMIDLAGVLFEKAGTLETAKYHSFYNNESSNTYLYAFEFESDDTSFPWLFMGHNEEIEFEGGVTHTDELLYLFTWPALMEGQQVIVKDRLVKLWTNFATYGDPTPDEDKDKWNGELGIPKWENFDVFGEHYMLMESQFTLQQDYSKRWTVTNDEKIVANTPDPPKDPALVDAEQQRDAFLATMITFIVLFVLAAGAAGFFLWKWRST